MRATLVLNDVNVNEKKQEKKNIGTVIQITQ